MAESIKNFIIKDAHGGTKESGSFSVVGEVHVNIVPGYGEPYADSEYINGTLTITIHNIEGNGITEITTNSQEGDEAVNTVTIKTNDNPKGVVLEVRNGSRGQVGPQGPQGIPGEGAIWTGEGEEIMTLEQKTGQAINKAMSQKAVSELVEEKVMMAFYPHLAAAIDGETGAVSSSTTQSVWVAKVVAGDKLFITATNSESKGFRVGFFADKPSVGDTISIASSLFSNDVAVELTAPFDGFLCVNHITENFADTEIYKVQKKLQEGSCQESKLAYNTTPNIIINYTTGIATQSQSWWSTDYINVSGLPYIIYERHAINVATSKSGMAFYDANKVFITGQKCAYTDGEQYDILTKIAVPDNAVYARFPMGTFEFSVYAPKPICFPEKVIKPTLRFGHIRTGNGEIGQGNYEKKILATPRYIKIDTSFTMTSSATVYVEMFYYDKTFAYLGHSAVHGTSDEYIAVNAGTPTKIPVTNDTAYVKFQMFNDPVAGTDHVEIPDIELTGNFADKWDMFNNRPLDSGYQRIVARVRVTDPTCCDNTTDSVQDSGEILIDYGIIALPSQYSNIGKPTRLIIYCHGAAVNYAADVIRFNAVDLEPDYWLAEGYAVMDIEGNPFDNTNEHICIPQAMDCYVAAYKWAIEHYNVCRDGVFIGGRSMGGYNTFNLIRRECPIPVIAACPNVPSGEGFGYSNATRKAFCALHMGFDVPSGFVWSNRMYTPEELEILSNNWDKWCKCVPIFNMCTDLPSKNVLLQALPDLDTRREALSQLHAVAKCPVKLFGCYEDESCPPEDTSALYYRMLMNSAQIAELRLFHSYKDYTGTGTSAHHYDTQDEALRTDVTTRYGEELTNIPVVYVEMLRFWQRYEQEEL